MSRKHISKKNKKKQEDEEEDEEEEERTWYTSDGRMPDVRKTSATSGTLDTSEAVIDRPVSRPKKWTTQSLTPVANRSGWSFGCEIMMIIIIRKEREREGGGGGGERKKTKKKK